jgi:hypothetical protein
MTHPHPKSTADLLLAPVAVEIDSNLQELRDKPPGEIDDYLQLENDRPPIPNTREQRQADILAVAVRNVDLHHWTCEISADACRLQLSGGSVTLELALSATIMQYIGEGV